MLTAFVLALIRRKREIEGQSLNGELKFENNLNRYGCKMGNTKLPDGLREKIKALFRKGYSSIEVHKMTIEEASKAGVSHEEFNRCLASIEGKVTQE